MYTQIFFFFQFLHLLQGGGSYFWKMNIPRTAAKDTRSAVTHTRQYSSGLCKQDTTFSTQPLGGALLSGGGTNSSKKGGGRNGVLTMIQTGEGTLLRTCGASEDTEGTPPHHSSEKSQGSLTVCTVTLMLLPV